MSKIRIARRFTKNLCGGPLMSFSWENRLAEIRDPDGKVVFRQEAIRVPSFWSHTASNVLAQKYFRRTGVPVRSVEVLEDGVPAWLRRRVPATDTDFTGENDAAQVFHRLAGCWSYWGWKEGLFASEEDVRAFYDEVMWLLATQRMAPNSPTFFNGGLHWAYGITGTNQGFWYADAATGEAIPSPTSYERIAAHACHLLSVKDSLVEEGGIMDLFVCEARIFKMGAGAGVNVSDLRAEGEPLSNGGYASGPMSWLKIGDTAAGGIKSGGTCLAPHARVVTADGLIQVKQLAASQRVFLCYSYDCTTKSYVAKKARAFVSGHKTTLRVTTDKAVVSVSYDHPIRMFDGWYLPAYQLKSGDLVSGATLDDCAFPQWKVLKVLKVEHLGSMDVYDVQVDCITTDERAPWSGHNFLIANEADRPHAAIAVHNTRRAALLRCMDIDHPDIEKFINWKVIEEEKVAFLVAGSAAIEKMARSLLEAIGKKDEKVVEAIRQEAIRAGIPARYVQRLEADIRRDPGAALPKKMDVDWRSEAYRTVSAQNANNSVRLSNDFMRAVKGGKNWDLLWRVSGTVARSIPAAHLWDQINHAAWKCADPGLQFDTTINEWNPTPELGRIRTANPCAEYNHLLDTACNLLSVNLLSFLDDQGVFGVDDFEHVCRLGTIILEITVEMSHLPSARSAINTARQRQLGIGVANLGALLMAMGLPYDSDRGRAIAAAVQCLLHCTAGKTSAEMAAAVGPFADYSRCRDSFLRVMRNHRAASDHHYQYENLQIEPPVLDERSCPSYLLNAARDAASQMVKLGEEHGYRNAQFSVNAPTGTISLIMDCQTTGVEPDFSLVRFKSLAGGGSLLLINQLVGRALRVLGYTPEEIDRIEKYIAGQRTLRGMPYHDRIQAVMGYESFDAAEKSCGSLYHIQYAFDRSLMDRCGLSDAQWEEVNHYVCGHGCAEGAPDLKPEHLAVFDCAVPTRQGGREISTEGHIRMLAALQPFISGSSSKTINCPALYTVKDIANAHWLAWQLAVKCVAVYRNESKLSQPMEVAALVADRVTTSSAPVVGRRRLPDRRGGVTQKIRIGGDQLKLHLRTGEYPDGTLGEIFIDLHKEGATFRSVMNQLAIAVSLGLQYGVPLEEFVDAFVGVRFEPYGMVTGHDAIKMTTSLIDCIFRDLAIHYLERHDLANVPPGEGNGTITNQEMAVMRSSPVAPVPVKSGTTGEACPRCGNFSMTRTGPCSRCDVCGESTGCN